MRCSRQREGGRLARARGRLAEQVAALEQQRNRLALDGRGLLVAEREHRRDDGLVEAEGGETDSSRLSGRRVTHR